MLGSRWELAEHLGILVLLAFWAVPFTRAQGGRGVHNELMFTAFMIPVLVLVRAWRAPAASLAASVAVSLAAVLVCVFSPTGWYGSDVAVSYVLAGAAYVAARRYVRDDERRNLLAAAICLAGLYQFEQSFLAWWGSRSPSTEMSGTFYWHNPYAAFLLPGAVIGLGLIATRRSPWTYVGWTSAPLCAAGIVFSSSRATLAVLVVAWTIMLAASALQRATLVRVGGAVLIAGGLLVVLTGPPFFPHRASPFAAATVRSDAGESLSQNAGYRTEFWRAAAEVALHRPVVGGGYHSLARASALYTPSGWARSPLAHNGYLQALSDGGLLLGVPFLVSVVVVALWALRRFWALISRRERAAIDLTGLSITLAVLGGLAHSAVDFDWSHPSILIEMALLAACVAPRAAGACRPTARSLQAGRIACLFVLGGVLVTCIPALHQWQVDQPSTRQSTSSLIQAAAAPFGDHRPAAVMLSGYVAGQRDATPAQVATALRLTASDASVDIHLQLTRYAAAARVHALPDPLGAARAELAHVDGSVGPYLPDLAEVMIAAGDLAQARTLLATDLRQQVAADVLAPDAFGELSTWATQLGRGGRYACLLAGVARVGGPGAVSALPIPSAGCRGPIDQASRR